MNLAAGINYPIVIPNLGDMLFVEPNAARESPAAVAWPFPENPFIVDLQINDIEERIDIIYHNNVPH